MRITSKSTMKGSIKTRMSRKKKRSSQDRSKLIRETTTIGTMMVEKESEKLILPIILIESRGQMMKDLQ